MPRWVSVDELLRRAAAEEMEELDRLTVFREPVEQQRDSIERSWGRSARQRARRRAEVAAVREAGVQGEVSSRGSRAGKHGPSPQATRLSRTVTDRAEHYTDLWWPRNEP